MRQPSTDDGSNNDRRSGAQPSTSSVEWIAAAVGLAVLAGCVAYLVYVGLSSPEGPPIVEVEAIDVHPQRGQFLVRFRARNDGNSTAVELVVEGKLIGGEKVFETAQMTIDYLPRNSEREGGLFFSRDPAEYRLVLEPVGYSAP